MSTDFITHHAFLLQVLGIITGLFLSLLYAANKTNSNKRSTTNI